MCSVPQDTDKKVITNEDMAQYYRPTGRGMSVDDVATAAGSMTS